MATINDKETIRELLENDGHYDGDPPAVTIWQYYTTLGQKITYCVFYSEMVLQPSEYVQNPVLLWSKWGNRLLPAGREFLEGGAS